MPEEDPEELCLSSVIYQTLFKFRSTRNTLSICNWLKIIGN